jgi:putative addiction module component (TIGR02574 family)
MGKVDKAAEILALPAAERLRLVEALWDSLAADATSVPIPDWHRVELDRRVDRHKAGIGAAAPWDEVKSRLTKRARKRPRS